MTSNFLFVQNEKLMVFRCFSISRLLHVLSKLYFLRHSECCGTDYFYNIFISLQQKVVGHCRLASAKCNSLCYNSVVSQSIISFKIGRKNIVD